MFGKFVEADDFALKQELPLRTPHGIKEALEAIDKVLSHELAFLAVENRIRREINSFAQFERVGEPHVLDRWHGFNHLRHEFGGARQVVINQQAFADRFQHRAGIEVAGQDRIKPRVLRIDGHADDFGGVSRGDRRANEESRQHQHRQEKGFNAAKGRCGHRH